MDGGPGLSAMDFLVPEYFSRIEVEAEDFPEMIRVGNFEAVASKVEALLRSLGLSQVDDGGEEDTMTPDNGARPTSAGDVGFPGDVFGIGPGVGKIGIFRDSTRICTTEGGPVFLADQREQEEGE